MQDGGNIFHDIGNGFKKAAKWTYNKVLVPTHKFVKDNKLVSKGLNMIPDQRAKAAGWVADQAGYGEHQMGADSHVGSSNL